MALEFRFRVPPLAHQRAVFDSFGLVRNFAIFWEMGLGKSKYLIDVAAQLKILKEIDAVVVLAPNGVHSNWYVPGEGIGQYLQEELLKESHVLVWHSKRAKQTATRNSVNKLFNAQFPWLVMAYDAVLTKSGHDLLRQFLMQYRCLFVLDESTRIKNPSSQRSKALKKLRPLAKYTRILTGTPVDQKPFDIYGQIDWLLPTFWHENGFGNIVTFRHYFGKWRRAKAPQGHEYDAQLRDKNGRLVYQNLEELPRILGNISSRLLKEEVLDLPPKSYQRLYYDLEPAQRKLYDQMEMDFVIWYSERKELQVQLNAVIAQHGRKSRQFEQFILDHPELKTSIAEVAMVRQMRLQQLAMGYVTDAEGNISSVVEDNPALAILQEVVEDLSHSAIIWCRFVKDVDTLCAAFPDIHVRYDGSTSDKDRVENIRLFQAGEKQLFIGTAATAGEGITLTRARTVIYYSNDWRLGRRLQSEDRAHRKGQEHPVLYIDVLGRDTIAENILAALQHGEEIAGIALGETLLQKHMIT